MRTATKTHLTSDQIAAICRRHLGGAPSNVVELKDGMYNTAYRLDLDKPYVLKVAPPDDVPVLRYEKGIFRSEVEVMRLVEARTTIPVPHIYAYDPSRDIIACDYYVMDFVEGVPLFGSREKMSEEALSRTDRESGEMLRQLNAIEGSRYGIYAQATHDSWRKAFEWLFMSLLADGKAIGVDLPYEELERRYRAYEPLLDAVNSPRLVHWDLWDGNIFLIPETGEITGIIDFERSLWGDPLMEFNFINASPAFLEGYGSNPLESDDAKRLRRLYTIYLCLVGIIEAPYRQYESQSAIQWAIDWFAAEYPQF